MDRQRGRVSRALSSPAFVLWLTFVLAPLGIGLLWGTTSDDNAYVTFRGVRNLAAGRGLRYDSPLVGLVTSQVSRPGSDLPALWAKLYGRQSMTGSSGLTELQSSLRSPLYGLVLWIPAVLGRSLPQSSLVLSALGWGVAALAIYRLGRTMQRPVAAITSAALVALSPGLVPVLGTEVAWVAALAWLAVSATANQRWRLQIGVVMGMLCLRFEPSTLAAATLCLSIHWAKRRRFPLWPALGVVIIALIWAALTRLGVAAPVFAVPLSLREWVQAIDRLLSESELYWLYLPVIGIGLVSLRTSTRALWLGVPWVAVAILEGGAAASAMVTTLLALLAGLGIGTLTRTILSPARVRRVALATGLGIVLASPLAVAQASSLVQRYRFRPLALQALEGEAARWLRNHSEPTATVLGSARVGFLSDRAAYPWNGGHGDAAAYTVLIDALAKYPPDYCISHNSLNWERLTRTAWFQDDYVSSQRFYSPYDAASPLTVWRYAPSTKPRPVEATFGDQIRLLSVLTVDSVASGEELAVRLDWMALQSVDRGYIVFVHLLDGLGERIASHDGVPRDRQTPTYTWYPGYVVPDVHRFPVPPDTPVGTYELWAGMYTWPDLERLPVWDREGVEQANRTLFLRTIRVSRARE